ncbi:MAG: GNAT family N-acetyltransferase [bacterium]|jgi:GNAT superfamily N-acetyltransferase
MIALRPASPADIPLLQELAYAIWHQVFTTIITPDQTDLMLETMYDPATIRREMDQGFVWKVLEEDHVAIGYISYSMTSPAECKLHKIYLQPGHHGKGFGKLLMKDAMAYARSHGARTLVLRVNRANAKALRAYRAFGFREAEPVEWEFAPGFILHDYKMTLTL